MSTELYRPMNWPSWKDLISRPELPRGVVIGEDSPVVDIDPSAVGGYVGHQALAESIVGDEGVDDILRKEHASPYVGGVFSALVALGQDVSCPGSPVVRGATVEGGSGRPKYRMRRVGASEASKIETRSEPKFTVRDATPADIAVMVDIDMRSFSKVYEGYPTDVEAQRADLKEKFLARYNLVGGKWMPVVTQKGKDGVDEVVGFMNCCPTSKDPEDFVSWEETTNNGRLDTLYDPNGRNIYVVTLSMDPSVKGQRGQNLLFVQQLSKFMGYGMNTAFFESRMPGLRAWATARSRAEGHNVDALSDDEKFSLATEYFGLTRERKGKTVPYDPLLKVYDGFGCKLLKVVPDAYKDEPSLNFGVLCTLENPTPRWMRNSKIARTIAGGTLALIAKSSWLSRKAFG